MRVNGVQQIKIACAHRIFFPVIPDMPLSGNDILHDIKMLLERILTADAIGYTGRSTPCHRNKQQGILRNRIIVVEYQLIPFMNVFKFHLIPHPESASCVSLPYGRASNPQKYVSRIYYTIFSTAFQALISANCKILGLLPQTKQYGQFELSPRCHHHQVLMKAISWRFKFSCPRQTRIIRTESLWISGSDFLFASVITRYRHGLFHREYQRRAQIQGLLGFKTTN